MPVNIEFGSLLAMFSILHTVYSTPEAIIALHLTRSPLGTWQATLLRRSGDLFSDIDSGRRILMNNAG